MVKKIRVIQDDTAVEELDQADYQAKMLEYQQAIDWKLWEILKIAQAWAAREGLVDVQSDTPTKTPSNITIKSVIIDEDE